MLKIYLALIVVIIAYTGCSQSKKRIQFVQIKTYDKKVTNTKKRNVKIHGMEGKYPSTYKDKQLGDGLFNHVFFDIAQRIENEITENIDREVIISIKTSNKERNVKEVVKEAIKYFKFHKDFHVKDNNTITKEDVVLEITEDVSLKFRISFHSDITENATTFIIDDGFNIDDFAANSQDDWSIVKIPDVDNNIVSYKIMKDPVTLSQYNSKKTGTKPITNINFNNASKFCENQFNGFVSPLYIFEYALRKGAINSPSNGISKEMVGGFDDANEEDLILKRPDDIVKSDMKEEDESYSEIVVFNYKTKRYKFFADSHVSQTVTFRCAK